MFVSVLPVLFLSNFSGILLDRVPGARNLYHMCLYIFMIDVTKHFRFQFIIVSLVGNNESAWKLRVNE